MVRLRLNAMIKKSGKTKRDVARLAGISESAIYRIEQVNGNVTLKTLYKLSRVLDCKVTDLMEDD